MSCPAESSTAPASIEGRFQPGKQPFQAVGPAFQKLMDMAALAGAGAWAEAVGQGVPVEDLNLAEEGSQRRSGAKSAHARADHDGGLSKLTGQTGPLPMCSHPSLIQLAPET